jgi:hypothetical protein
MPYDDDVRDEPARPTLLVYRCRRCDGLVEETHPDAEVALRRAIESGMAFSVHACSDGAEGVAELVGTGPGRPRRSRAA